MPTRQATRSILTLALITVCLLAFAAIGTAHAQTTPTVTYYHNDLAGSPVAATNAAGQVIWRERYRAYGERVIKDPAGQDNGEWYTGHHEDSDTGLVYMGARLYDPKLGRFLSPDPVHFVEGNLHSFNRYAYANNNPATFVDPDGRDAVGIVFRGYQVDTGYGFKLPLGHGGVLLIDRNNGRTKYYEYGRYDPNDNRVIGEKLPETEGNVRNVQVPNAKLDQDGKVTHESLQRIYDFLSKGVGKGNPVDTTYHEDADFKKGVQYVESLANNKERKKYSIYNCNCYDFKNRTIQAARPKE